MIIAQIVILSIVTLVYGLSLYTISRDKDIYAVTFNIMSFFTILVISIAAIFSANMLKSNSPCPELEKIENVYKMK